MNQKGNVLILLLVVVVAVITAGFILIENMTKSISQAQGIQNSSSKYEKIPSPDELSYQYSGDIVDVNNLGLNGKANTSFFGGSFTLYAKINNLKEPNNGSQYIGWLAKRNDAGGMRYFKAGSAVKNADTYVNIFQGGTDVTNHNYYILSQESDDQVEMPSNKVVEAFLIKNQIQPTPVPKK